MKQMICLLSDQLVPTYLAVKHERPERVWRILSAEMVRSEKDQTFCSAVHQYIDPAIEFPDCSAFIAQPDRFVSAQQLVEGIIEEAHTPDTRWIVNVTGGNKMISSGALVAAVVKDVAVSYTEFGTPGQLVDARTGEPTVMAASLKVDEFLALYGFEARPGREITDNRWVAFAYALALDAPKENPWNLPAVQRAGLKERDLQYQGIKNYTKFLRPSFLTTHGDSLSEIVGHDNELKGWQYGFIAGKWIETFLFDLLRKNCKALRLADLRFAVQVMHDGVSNDLDIAFTQGLNFCYIECKTGVQMNKSAANQIEETLGTINRLRAFRTKALLVTTGENFLNRGSATLSRSAAARLREAGMNILTRSQIAELAKSQNDSRVVVPILKSFIEGTP